MGFLTRNKVEIMALLVYCVVGGIYTYPLLFNMRSVFYGGYGDPSGTIWHFWLLKNIGIWNFASVSKVIAYPFGYDLSLVPHQLSGEFLGWFLALTVDEVFAYNFILFLSYPLSGIFMYLLSYHLTRNRPGSFIAGLIYSVSSYHTHHAIGHLLLSTIQWMPLYILCLIKLDEERNYRYAFLTGLTFALVSLDSFYHGLFMTIVSITFLCYRLVSESLRNRCLFIYYRAIKLFLSVIATIFFTTLPATYPIFKNIIATSHNTSSYAHPISDLYVYSSRPWEYLIPSANHPVLGKYALDIMSFTGLDLHGSNFVEQTIFLGYASILLTMVTIVLWIKDKNRVPALDHRTYFTIRFFVLVALVAFLFSLPPTIEFGCFDIQMPSSVIYKFVKTFRAYVRFSIVVALSVALLSGVAIKFLLNGRKTWFKAVITLLITFFILFESYVPPFYTRIEEIPPEYKWLSEQRGKLIIAEYPLASEIDKISSAYLFWQRIHRKVLINGYARGSVGDKFREKIFYLSPSTIESLRKIGVDYIIVHNPEYSGSLVVDGLKLIKSFDRSLIYQIDKRK